MIKKLLEENAWLDSTLTLLLAAVVLLVLFINDKPAVVLYQAF